MSKLLKNPLLLCLLLLAGLYFLSGVIDAGKELNSIPWLGWCFWGLLALVVIYFLLVPLCEFFYLPSWHDPAEMDDLSEKNRFLKRYAKHLIKRFPENNVPDEIKDGIEQLRIQLGYQNPDMDKIENAISEIRKILADTVARKIIRSYMKQAALIVVVSPKGWLDSVALLLLQIKLIKELSSNLGYRPSGTFLFCCCTWCLSNSLIASLFDETNLGENVAGLLGELTGEKIFSSIPGIDWLTSNLMQLIYAATAVFSTGIMMQEYLMGDSRRRTVKDLLLLRLRGLKEGKELAAELFSSKCSLKF